MSQASMLDVPVLFWHLANQCNRITDKSLFGCTMRKPIINIDEIEFSSRPAAFAAKGPAAERFDAKMAIIAPKIGAQKLGFNVTSVPPGKRAFPFHNHRVNEEMFFILQGTGEVRIGSDRFPIRKGDVISCPPGGPETAHQIINTSAGDLQYLAVSTRLSPEIAEYPDSGKFGVLADFSPGPDGTPTGFRFVSRPNEGIDYWDGE